MKVAEALNLYNLHSKPEQLTNHDKASAMFNAKYHWAILNAFFSGPYDTPTIETKSDFSTLQELDKSWFAHNQETLQQEIQPFDRHTFWNALEHQKETWFSGDNALISVNRYNRHDEDVQWQNQRVEKQIKMFDRAEQQLAAIIKKFSPKTMWCPEPDAYALEEGCLIGVFDCEPQVLLIAARQ